MRNEIHQWWLRRHTIKLTRQTMLSLAALALLLLAVLVPWRATVPVPGVLLAGEFRPIYAPERGRIHEILVQPRARVNRATPLIRLEQPDLQHTLGQTQRELALVEERIQRQVGSSRDLQDALVLTQQKEELKTKLFNLQQRTQRLTITAPIQGIVSRQETLQTGQWVSENAPLMTLRSEQGLRVMALVSADDIHRIQEGAEATWISNLPGSPVIALRLQRIDRTALQHLVWPELASEYGGTVPVRKTANQQLRPEGAWYQLELESTAEQAAPTLQQAGLVQIKARPESVIGRYWRHAVAIWIRESGF